MLRINGICFSYGKGDVLENISCNIGEGEVVAILGRNGSGKTTLLKTINRLLKPYRGTVVIGDILASTMSHKEISKIIGYVPQKSDSSRCTVFDAILLGRKPYIRWTVSERDIQIVKEMSELMGLQQQIMRNTTELSGGEFQKVIIARALAQEPKILLLDEPVNHLDIKNQIEALWHISDITKKLNIITMIVLHDLNMAMRFSDKYLLLKDGHIFAFGSQEVMNEKNIKEVFDISVHVMKINGATFLIPKG